MPVSRRLLTLSGLSALLTVAVGAIALLALWRAAVVGREMGHYAHGQELAGRVRADALMLGRYELQLRLTPAQPERAAELRRRFAKTDADLRAELYELEGHLTGADDRADIARIRQALDDYDLGMAELFGAAVRADPRGNPAAAPPERGGSLALGAIDTTADSLVMRGRARQLASQSELERISRDLLAALAGSVAAVVMLSLFIGHRLQRTIARPVRETLAALERVAGGDLSPVLEAGNHDELGRIATSLNTAITRMRSDREQIERLAATDPLTGLMNRRAFSAALQQEIARGRRYGLPLSLLLMDVDHFKHVNDEYGHAAGDLVLARLGKLLGVQLRNTDYCARWGGEEFVAALPHVGLDGAAVAAGRIRATCAEMEIALEAKTLRVTVSIGVAELHRDDTLQSLTERADHAMYAAKRRGRDRVVIDDGHLEAEPVEATVAGKSGA